MLGVLIIVNSEGYTYTRGNGKGMTAKDKSSSYNSTFIHSEYK